MGWIRSCFSLAGGDHLELHHALEDQVLPIAGDRGFPQGVVASRGFGNSGQQGALGLGQFLRVLVEIETGGLDDAPGPIPEVDFVEIHLQNLLLGVFAFIFQGQEAFLELPLDGFFAGKIFVLDQLLGDRRAPLGHFPFDHVLDQGAGDAAQVDSSMFVKTGVFNGHQGILQEDGNLVDGDPISFLGQDPAHETRLVVKDLDGNVAGRKGRIRGYFFLGLNRRAGAQEKEKSQGGKDPFYSAHRFPIIPSSARDRLGTCRGGQSLTLLPDHT